MQMLQLKSDDAVCCSFGSVLPKLTEPCLQSLKTNTLSQVQGSLGQPRPSVESSLKAQSFLSSIILKHGLQPHQQHHPNKDRHLEKNYKLWLANRLVTDSRDMAHDT